ncbi:MAG TPA: histidine phosphatase family protein [Bryobacteraceae bacterium]|jgi:broad specificity phosphatase PhoE|nr:histidine phosphatase family protein [Bryobacteraceae bacterium]
MPGLFVVRHCEPAVTGVLLGQCDPPLSEAGRAHAASLRLPKLAAIFSSPLRRARETAEAIARGAPVQIIDDLREISYGAWDGRAWREIEAEEIAARKMADWRGVTPPGGEPWRDFESRVARALERIRAGPRPAAIVAHAAVNRVIANIDQDYGGIHEL